MAHHLTILPLSITTLLYTHPPLSGWLGLYASVLFIMFWHAQITSGASVSLGFQHLIYKWMTAVQAICKLEFVHAGALCMALSRATQWGGVLINEGYLQ